MVDLFFGTISLTVTRPGAKKSPKIARPQIGATTSKKISMHFARDAFAHEEARFEMPGGPVLVERLAQA
jgi:hypothetical protein